MTAFSESDKPTGRPFSVKLRPFWDRLSSANSMAAVRRVFGWDARQCAPEPGALRSHPGFQIGDQRRAEFLTDRLAPFGALSVDRPLDLEQRIDPADRFQRQRRDHRRLLALSFATRVLGQISHHEERTP